MATKKKHPLSHLVPDQSYADGYISRVLPGNIRDLDLMQYCMDFGRNMLLSGPTGPGKTSMILAYAAEHKLPLVTVQCNGGVDSASLFGLMVQDSEKNVFYQDSDVTQVIQHGGILYLDEVNFLPQKVAAAFQALTDKRRYITILEDGNRMVKAHDDLLIVTAFNPGYQGVKPLNYSFLNRFSIKVDIDYDPVIESALIGVPALLALATKLRHAQNDGTVMTPTSTNLLMEFEDIAIDLGIDYAIANFVNHYDPTERSAVRDLIEVDLPRITAEVQKVADSMVSE